MKKQWGLVVCAFILGLGLLFSWGCRADAMEPFQVSQYCTDRAGVLTGDQAREISQVLGEYHRQTGNQLLVVTIPSLEGEDVTDFTQRMFEANKPGQKGKDNGLVMLLAIQEHKLWISTGYGLEEAVPDGKAGEIRDRMFPYFRANDFYHGIRSGVQLLMQAITPGYTSGIAASEAPAAPRRSSFSALAWIIFLVIAAFSYLGNLGSSRRRRRGFSEPWFWGGGGYGGGGGFGGGSGGFGGGSSGGFSGGGGSFGGGGSGGSW